MRLPIRFYQLGRKFVFYHRLMVELLLEQAKGSLTQLNRFARPRSVKCFPFPPQAGRQAGSLKCAYVCRIRSPLLFLLLLSSYYGFINVSIGYQSLTLFTTLILLCCVCAVCEPKPVSGAFLDARTDIGLHVRDFSLSPPPLSFLSLFSSTLPPLYVSSPTTSLSLLIISSSSTRYYYTYDYTI